MFRKMFFPVVGLALFVWLSVWLIWTDSQNEVDPQLNTLYASLFVILVVFVCFMGIYNRARKRHIEENADVILLVPSSEKPKRSAFGWLLEIATYLAVIATIYFLITGLINLEI